jgi:hypothetical protein
MEQFTIYLKEPQKRQLLIDFLMKMDFLEWESLEKTTLKKELKVTSVTKRNSSTPAKDFVNKWKGFLSDADIENAKSNYLLNKYL